MTKQTVSWILSLIFFFGLLGILAFISYYLPNISSQPRIERIFKCKAMKAEGDYYEEEYDYPEEEPRKRSGTSLKTPNKKIPAHKSSAESNSITKATIEPVIASLVNKSEEVGGGEDNVNKINSTDIFQTENKMRKNENTTFSTMKTLESNSSILPSVANTSVGDKRGRPEDANQTSLMLAHKIGKVDVVTRVPDLEQWQMNPNGTLYTGSSVKKS